MDNDISHAVQEELDAIKLRLDALESGPVTPKEEEVVQEETWEGANS